MTEPSAPKHLSGLRLYSRLLLTVSLGLVIGAYLLRGIDFTLGVLLGSGIVGMNYLWSIRVFSRILAEDHPRVRLAISWVLKFGFTGLVLYLAIVKLGLHPVGIIVGVSAVAIAGLFLAAVRLAAR